MADAKPARGRVCHASSKRALSSSQWPVPVSVISVDASVSEKWVVGKVPVQESYLQKATRKIVLLRLFLTTDH